MRDLTVRQLEEYLLDHYQQSRTEEGLFIKLVEEVGEVAEVLNGRQVEKKVSKIQTRYWQRSWQISFTTQWQLQLSTIST